VAITITLLGLVALSGAKVLQVLPAPPARFSPPSFIHTTNGTVQLDEQGRGHVPSPASPLSRQFQFITVMQPTGGETIFYAPGDFSILHWLVTERDRNFSGRVLLKKHGDAWSHADDAPLQSSVEDGSPFFLLALPPGQWDLALLIPGRCPAILEGFKAERAGQAHVRSALLPAARLRARVRSAKDGKAVSHWQAFVQSVARGPETEVARLFAQQPIATDGLGIDFASLPPGAWQLAVGSPDFGMARRVLPPAEANRTIDLKDVFLSDAGSLRVLVSFPAAVPSGELEISVFRPSPSGDRHQRVLLARRKASPRPAMQFDFVKLDPGGLTVDLECPGSGLYREEDVTIQSDQLATLSVGFSPIRVHGFVGRGESPITGARIELRRKGMLSNVKSDDEGRYEVTVWCGGVYVFTARLTAAGVPFAEAVVVPDDSEDFPHDIHLPNHRVFGTVTDAQTSKPILGASVAFTQTETASDTTLVYEVKTPVDGSYELDDLHQEPVDLTVTAGGYAATTYRSVQPSVEGTKLDVQLRPGGRLTGRVVDDLGRPVPGAIVGVDIGLTGDDFAREVLASNDGGFTMDDVLRGPHTFVAFQCGYGLTARALDPFDSSNEPLVLVLNSNASPVIGHFEDASGHAVGGASMGLAIDGVALPGMVPVAFEARCGHPSQSDSDGNLTWTFLPFGSAVYGIVDRQVVGYFLNDGSQTRWNIVLPQ
jgi:Carboxypeptidase regulatory-like domain